MAKVKSSISFGLINIPVEINNVVRNNDTYFNQLHNKCMHTIKHIKYCPICKEEVNSNDLVKGYEYQNDEYITFTDEEFDLLKSDDEKIIEIVSFINLKEIDPVYFQKSYELSSDKNSKAYVLLKKAMKKSGKVALIKTVIRQKFYYAILRLNDESMIMTTLYFDEEVNIDDKVDETVSISDKEMELALKLIDTLKGKFEPDKYKDEYQDRIKDAIDKKISGKKIKKVKGKSKRSVSDLMKALEESLKDAK